MPWRIEINQLQINPFLMRPLHMHQEIASIHILIDLLLLMNLLQGIRRLAHKRGNPL